MLESDEVSTTSDAFGLPVRPAQWCSGKAMLEGTIPCHMATELRRAIKVTIIGDIRPAFPRLERAARVIG